ncbi:hypothetical protein QFC20_000365 [Naganishia adeliensis]|uniref:Uncharacterized protein n=1 Tax=Naganishia adeliensis TaxID=92952 RepID=A0ACC2X2D4_9TREE|nr:hypothetical protein QFC20_000365 [Naganishia adeliensis]
MGLSTRPRRSTVKAPLSPSTTAATPARASPAPIKRENSGLITPATTAVPSDEDDEIAMHGTRATSASSSTRRQVEVAVPLLVLAGGSSGGRKRKADTASLDSDDLDDEKPASKPAPRKKATTSKATTSRRSSKASTPAKSATSSRVKGKQKAKIEYLSDEGDDDFVEDEVSEYEDFEGDDDNLHEPDSDHIPDHTVKKVTRSTRTKKLAAEDFVELSSDDEDDIALSIALETEYLTARSGKGGDATIDDSSITIATPEQIAERKAERKRQLAAKAEARKPLDKMVKEEIKRLGRKLTQGEKNACSLKVHHPDLVDVWGDLQKRVKVIKPVTMEAHPSLKLTSVAVSKGELVLDEKARGGAVEGIQTIALLLSEPRQKPSLVVAPVVALMQWKHEIETHAEGFTVCLWHGTGRMKAEELKKYDVVLVSYGTLEASFRKQVKGFRRNNVLITEKSPMHAFQWYRVVLDEAHNIKERSTNAAKAAFALNAKYKWCLSGTPLQNRVGELYSLVRFLGGDPFAYYYCKQCPCKSLHWQFSDRRHCDDCGHSPMQHLCYWNNEILTPIQKYGMEGPGDTAFKKLKILLDRMMLRRTKLERADDLGLPPRTIIVRRDHFSPEEKELYLSLFSETRRTFSTYIAEGTVLNNYSNIFSLITRMRQMACHPDLVLRSKKAKYIANVGEEVVCRICNDIAEDAIISKCNHIFDRECIRQYLEMNAKRSPECPVCHLEISIDLEAEAIESPEDAKTKRQGILGRLDIDNWRSSTKLEALVEELSNLRQKDATIKSLVFSQFVSFLDLIAFRLQRAGFNICRLEGGLSPQARDATIKHFMNNTHVTVFLISLKAGGVALNLTEASRVYMMDSWWNPSVEYQAMDRIHRLGQKRPVEVIKLVVQDSIESKIVQLQEKKLAMTEAALSTDPDSALGKLTPEDVRHITSPLLMFRVLIRPMQLSFLFKL